MSRLTRGVSTASMLSQGGPGPITWRNLSSITTHDMTPGRGAGTSSGACCRPTGGCNKKGVQLLIMSTQETLVNATVRYPVVTASLSSRPAQAPTPFVNAHAQLQRKTCDSHVPSLLLPPGTLLVQRSSSSSSPPSPPSTNRPATCSRDSSRRSCRTT